MTASAPPVRDPHAERERSLRQARLIAVARIIGGLILLGLIALLAWIFLIPRWDPPPPAAPSEPSADRPDRVGVERIEGITISRDPPQITTQTGNRIDFGAAPERATPIVQRITVRLASGRRDPVVFGAPEISGEGSEDLTILTATPERLAEFGISDDDCFSGTVSPHSITGNYCSTLIEWRPREGRDLRATLQWTYAPFEDLVIREDVDIERIAGGWEPQTLRLNILGRAPARRPPAEVVLAPTPIAFGEGTSGRRLVDLRLTTRHRALSVTGIETVPPSERLAFAPIEGEQCVRDYTPAGNLQEDFCLARLRWDAGPGETLTDAALIILWHEHLTPGEIEQGLTAGRRTTRIDITGEASTEIPVERRVGISDLSTDPTTIEWDEGQTGVTQFRTVTLLVSGETARITRIVVSPGARRRGVTADTAAYGERCVRIYRPAGITGVDQCRIEISWSPIGTGPLSTDTERAELSIVWEGTERTANGIPIEHTNTIPMRGTVTPSPEQRRATRPEGVITVPNTIEFGRHARSPGTKLTAVDVRATHGPVRIDSVRILSPDPRSRAGLTLLSEDCTTTRYATADPRIPLGLDPESFCTIRMQWIPVSGIVLGANIEILYATAERPRMRNLIPITGEVLRPPPTSPEILAARTRAAARAELVAERARHITARPGWRNARARYLTARTAAAEHTARRWLDPDYRTIGVDSTPGASSRPVLMTNIVERNTEIAAVIKSTIQSGAPTPIVAIIERDVYSRHGVQVVIPRGSKIMGRTTGQSTVNTLSGASAPAPTGRLQIAWERLTLGETGTAFNVTGWMETTGEDGVIGAPGVIDHKELETYVAIMSQAAVRAATLLALPEKTIQRQLSTTGGETPTIVEETITPEERAIEELVDGFRTANQQIMGYILPTPVVTVPAGTRIKLIPMHDMILTPALARTEPQS